MKLPISSSGLLPARVMARATRVLASASHSMFNAPTEPSLLILDQPFGRPFVCLETTSSLSPRSHWEMSSTINSRSDVWFGLAIMYMMTCMNRPSVKPMYLHDLVATGVDHFDRHALVLPS